MGRCLSIILAHYGCRVGVVDIDKIGADKTAALITDKGYDAFSHELNVTSYEAVNDVINKTISRWGRLDYYINNAGIGISAEMQDISIDQWRKVIDVNLIGVINGTSIAYGLMLKQGFGHIVNIASMAGFAPFPVNIPYTASKFGVVGLTKSLQAEAAIHGIKVSLVCPGVIKTNFYRDIIVINVDREEYTGKLPSYLLTPEQAARKVVKGIATGKKFIVFPFHARLLYQLYRFAPNLFMFLMKIIVLQFRKLKNINIL